MKRSIFRTLFLILLSIVLNLSGLVGDSASLAQVPNESNIEQSQREKSQHDKYVSPEQVAKARAEALGIQDSIVKLMNEKRPYYKLADKRERSYDVPGRRGAAQVEISWESGNAHFWIEVALGLKKDEEVTRFRERLNTIAWGDFYSIPKLGDEAILVKNVSANITNTNVSLYFIKGRAQVSVRLSRGKSKTIDNEKELMAIIRLIEPLIVARPNFDD